MNQHQNNLGQPIGFPIKEWKARPRPPVTVMTGKYCRVEPMNINAHSEALYLAYGNDQDESNWTYLPYGPFDGFADFKVWLESDCCDEDHFFIPSLI